MRQFTANRLSGGNRLFPDSVEIDDASITVKIPGLFRGQSETIPFNRISSVKIETPLVGFSSIIVDTIGFGIVKATGFTKSEVVEMKKLIIPGKSGNYSSVSPIIIPPQEHESVQLRKLELERERELERKESTRKFIQQSKKHWKIWVPLVSIVLIISSVLFKISEKSSENKLEEAQHINLQLEQLSDTIQMMMNKHQNSTEILKLVNRLVHPSHIEYTEKTTFFAGTSYYDEYWNKIRENYKNQLMTSYKDEVSKEVDSKKSSNEMKMDSSENKVDIKNDSIITNTDSTK